MYQEPFEPQGQNLNPVKHPLQFGLPPSWASGWGQDEVGVFAELTVEHVSQKLRWIPAGSFMMGSPEEEQGRFSNEAPQHKVTIGSGFWLFDTPVTQALWFAVMGTTPSYFQGAERPVEQISWLDAKDFIDKLNSRIPDLGLRFPSEAEWEYACRAGTEGLNYAESLENEMEGEGTESLGQIAWYARNSDDQTHSVAQKEPNNFGLYDMLGNVWEWCEDEWHSNYEGAPNDGAAWLRQPSYPDAEGRGLRVIRGGSWGAGARVVRSAFRGRVEPSFRGDYLGFRCAGGPVELKQESKIPKA